MTLLLKLSGVSPPEKTCEWNLHFQVLSYIVVLRVKIIRYFHQTCFYVTLEEKRVVNYSQKRVKSRCKGKRIVTHVTDDKESKDWYKRWRGLEFHKHSWKKKERKGEKKKRERESWEVIKWSTRMSLSTRTYRRYTTVEYLKIDVKGTEGTWGT